MDRSERLRRITTLLRQFAPADGGLEALRPQADGDDVLESADSSSTALEKVIAGQEDTVSQFELDALEAIIVPGQRPVAFVTNGLPDRLGSPWTHLDTDAVRNTVKSAAASVGRVELPESPMPYGGTAFVVAPGVLMTNRHVAALFADGVGDRRLRFSPGDAAIDFLREKDSAVDDHSALVEVGEVVMVHPYWDMALLRVDGLADRAPLVLDVRPPEELVDLDVVTVGYPARDHRNNPQVQDRVFRSVYDVKRVQPGKLRARRRIRSFGNQVLALTHDCSTLGGNSGSALVDPQTGRVVALHFAGRYLDANFAVPTWELARDRRVVARGLGFAGVVEPSKEVRRAWTTVDVGPPPTTAEPTASAVTTAPSHPAPVTTLTVPLHITVTLGDPTPQVSAGVGPGPASTTSAPVEWPSRVPIIYPRLNRRGGYWDDFLRLQDDVVLPMPHLTDAGREVAAPLEDGTFELAYHKFSIVMHKHRRLALFGAAMVDWRPHRRKADGRKPTRRQLTGLPEGYAEEWTNDPRIADEHQLPDVFFTDDRTAFDKGHIVRRDDVVWGNSFREMQKANGDTYHTTNCSPQTAVFNRSSRGVDNWGDLENLVQKQTKEERAVTFAGPVFADDDPVFVGEDLAGRVEVQIPRRYWKIVVVRGDDGARAFGFVVEQSLDDVELEFAVPQRWTPHMRAIADIEAMCNGWLDLSYLVPYDQFTP